MANTPSQKPQVTPSPDALLQELPRARLSEIARLYGVSLPEGSREEQVLHLLATVEIGFSSLLSRLCLLYTSDAADE